jgi:hypothetical protein
VSVKIIFKLPLRKISGRWKRKRKRRGMDNYWRNLEEIAWGGGNYSGTQMERGEDENSRRSLEETELD